MPGPCHSGRSEESRSVETTETADPEIRLSFEANPQPADIDALSNALSAFNVETVGIDDYQPLAFFLRDTSGAVVGGITGATVWGWFEIGVLWVREDVRGRGFGGQLLAAAEAEATRRGCRHAVLDTFAFQAPDFYKARGYEVFGTLLDFPPGHAKYFMVKHLPGDSAQAEGASPP